MKSRAAVAFKAGTPLEIVEVDLEGPKAGEVLVEIGDEPELVEAWNKIARKAAMEALIGTD